eukprot:scaffold462_cov195-Pinguiococcus_pyrenoidosus.AAC.17
MVYLHCREASVCLSRAVGSSLACHLCGVAAGRILQRLLSLFLTIRQRWRRRFHFRRLGLQELLDAGEDGVGPSTRTARALGRVQLGHRQRRGRKVVVAKVASLAPLRLHEGRPAISIGRQLLRRAFGHRRRLIDLVQVEALRALAIPNLWRGGRDGWCVRHQSRQDLSVPIGEGGRHVPNGVLHLRYVAPPVHVHLQQPGHHLLHHALGVLVVVVKAVQVLEVRAVAGQDFEQQLVERELGPVHGRRELQHLEHDAPEAPQIGREVIALSPQHLRRHVQRRAHSGEGVELLQVQEAAEAQVTQLHQPRAREKHVSGLDVSMDDAPLMHELQRLRQLPHGRPEGACCHVALLSLQLAQIGLEVSAVRPLQDHHEVAGLEHAVDEGHDVGVHQLLQQRHLSQTVVHTALVRRRRPLLQPLHVVYHAGRGVAQNAHAVVAGHIEVHVLECEVLVVTSTATLVHARELPLPDAAHDIVDLRAALPLAVWISSTSLICLQCETKTRADV